MRLIIAGKDYAISCINAEFSEDRPNVIGICRMTDVEIEVDGTISEEEEKELRTNILNHFAEDEYHTEDKNWVKDAEKAIRKYTNAKCINIVF